MPATTHVLDLFDSLMQRCDVQAQRIAELERQVADVDRALDRRITVLEHAEQGYRDARREALSLLGGDTAG
jgi:hypothetical protein